MTWEAEMALVADGLPLAESRKYKMGAILGWTAAILNGVGFVIYCTPMLTGDALNTNPLSWWFWFIETLTSLVIIYHYLEKDNGSEGGHKSVWATEAVSMVGVTIVSLYLLLELHRWGIDDVFSAVETIDYVVTGLAIFSLAFWHVTRKRYGSGLAVWISQFGPLAAVYPLWRATLENPTSEPFWAWIIWTLAFALQTVSGWLRVRTLTTIVGPIVYTVTHLLVVLAIILGTASS